jgi:hypothetical protein
MLLSGMELRGMELSGIELNGMELRGSEATGELRSSRASNSWRSVLVYSLKPRMRTLQSSPKLAK